MSKNKKQELYLTPEAYTQLNELVIKSIRDGRRKSMSAFVSEAILQFFPSTDEKKEQKDER